MVAVSKGLSRQTLEPHVVLDVRRRDDDDPRPGVREDDAFEAAKARRFEVLDDLDDRGDIEILQSAIPVGEGALKQLDALTAARGHRVEIQASGGDLECTVRNVNPDDVLDRR